MSANAALSQEKRVIPQAGELVPSFYAPILDGRQDFAFDTVAGRPIILLFFGNTAIEPAYAALNFALQHHALFDDQNCCLFGVTITPDDVVQKRIAQRIPGIRHFLDFDRNVSTRFGAYDPEQPDKYAAHWLVLDRCQRVQGRYRLEDGERAIAKLRSLIEEAERPSWAPVLEVPHVLSSELCDQLVALYEREGGEDSGFMREIDGKTVLVTDYHHKRRSDLVLTDETLRGSLQSRIFFALKPMIARAFQFEATRMERYIVACYDAETSGHFRAHRDNTTKGTAHRRFAVTINLNPGEYGGGDLMFPEFGQRTYCAPKGGAIVFSCSLLHQAMPVTKGKRYAFLPFLYDEAAAQIREDNSGFVDGGSVYRK